MKRLLLILLNVLLALPLLAEPADTFATAIRQRIDVLMQDKMFERSHVGLYVYDITADSALYEHGKRQTLRPASNMKVMTAAAALSTLGTDYRLQTRLYIASVTEPRTTAAEAERTAAAEAEFMPPAADAAEQAATADAADTPSAATADAPAGQAESKSGGSARIIVKGGMDPLLGPDDLRAFAQALKDRGITTIKSNIICDATFKDTVSMGWGWCWDDDYVPLTPFLYLGQAGKFEAAFRKALKNAGIAFTGKFVHGRLPQGSKLLVTREHTIDQVLQPMMKKSDNLFAECLFYHLASKGGKVHASNKDAAAKVGQFIKIVGRNPADYTIADGSGLSLYNYLSPELLVDVLRYVYKHQDIYDHLYPSLPIMGRDGTLRKRCNGEVAQDRVHAKTGTVRGVSSLSGYAQAPNGHLLAFSIINQGIPAASVGRDFQDRVCCALTRPIKAKSIEPDALPAAPVNEKSAHGKKEGASANEDGSSANVEGDSASEESTSASEESTSASEESSSANEEGSRASKATAKSRAKSARVSIVTFDEPRATTSDEPNSASADE